MKGNLLPLQLLVTNGSQEIRTLPQTLDALRQSARQGCQLIQGLRAGSALYQIHTATNTRANSIPHHHPRRDELWNLHFGIATRRGRVHSGHDPGDMGLNPLPIVRAEYQQSQLSPPQILLIP